jgi:2,6-dihydroxypseudooxynicotine hydrolase
LRKPNASNNPVLIMAPGLDSTKEEIHAYEEPFLARGIAVLAIDGPGQGEAEYDIPICGDYERAAGGGGGLDRGPQGPECAEDRHLGREPGRLLLAPRRSIRKAHQGRASRFRVPYEWDRIWDGLPELTRETFRVRSPFER